MDETDWVAVPMLLLPTMGAWSTVLPPPHVMVAVVGVPLHRAPVIVKIQSLALVVTTAGESQLPAAASDTLEPLPVATSRTADAASPDHSEITQRQAVPTQVTTGAVSPACTMR